MIISSLFSVGSYNGFPGVVPHSDGLGYPYNKYQSHISPYQDTLYKGNEQYTVSESIQPIDHFYDFDKKQHLKDKDIKIYERTDRSLKPNGYRTFVWQSKQIDI